MSASEMVPDGRLGIIQENHSEIFQPINFYGTASGIYLQTLD
jgi:hypothetical protein